MSLFPFLSLFLAALWQRRMRIQNIQWCTNIPLAHHSPSTHFGRVSLTKYNPDGSSHHAAAVKTLAHKTRLAVGETDVVVSDAVMFSFPQYIQQRSGTI